MFFKKSTDIFEEFTPIFNSLTDAVVFYGKNSKIIYYNDSFKQLAGLQDDELKNFEIGTRLIKNEKYLNLALIFFPSVVSKNIKTLREKPIEIIDVEIFQPEEIHFQIANLELNYNKNKYLVKIISDKTAIIKKEKEISEFLNLSAHHIRTPLNEIKWALETMKNGVNGDNLEIMNTTLKIIDNTLMLAEGILLSIQIETGKVKIAEEENDVNEVIKNLLQIIEEIIKERKLKVDVNIDVNAAKFKFDKRILSVVLFAILENAALYNKEFGEIKIEAERLQDKPFVRISVSDTGCGIPESEQAKIFGRYFRGEKAKEIKPQGFGLGTYLSKKLTELLGGSINFISERDKGTTFFVEIPVK